jgi:hypothetical protein
MDSSFHWKFLKFLLNEFASTTGTKINIHEEWMEMIQPTKIMIHMFSFVDIWVACRVHKRFESKIHVIL